MEMEMDAYEDFSGCNDHLIIVKGNRNKRPRQPSPAVGRVVTSNSSSVSGLIAYNAPSFTMCSDDDDHHSNETADSTLDDENMANCLIYLAQSGGCVRQEETNKRFNEVVSNTTTKIKAGFFLYECKTCNRNFPSFQALGGHRASHKRPKIMEKEDQKAGIFASSQRKFDEDEEEIGGKFKRLSEDIISPEFEIKLADKVLIGNHKANNNKIHECSFCGSEFSSGQALGGHMRRHRNSSNAKVNNTTTSIDVKPVEIEREQPRRVFQLDLNLPAPEDDHRDLKFQFPADQQKLVLTASAF